MLPRIMLSILVTLSLSAAASAELRKFEMTIEEVDIEVAPGFSAKVWAFNGQVPGPLIHVVEGDELEIVVHNFTTLSHTVHWHGVYQTGSWQSDGVPDVTQKAIEPGESYTYRFVVDKPGSLWYHCHVNVAEHVGLRGMWGPLVIDPKEPTARTGGHEGRCADVFGLELRSRANVRQRRSPERGHQLLLHRRKVVPDEPAVAR